MDSMGVFSVSASALQAERERLNVIASNMANANSTRTEEGGPYKRRDVVFSAEPVGGSGDSTLEGVRVEEIVKENAFRKYYDPSHPDADKNGYVTAPDINVIEEMVNMMTAYRAYEASVSTFNTTKSMILKTLELGN
ncbi:MAG: flagellar basal body rod protein FlgC [Nitrospiraceae bacterium]|nr:flagellar basal body rod protein FlgC [Nitrospiraceae bacterium]